VTRATGTLPVDAIIFDMDGVLVGSEPLRTRATTLLLAGSRPPDALACRPRAVSSSRTRATA
jgi:beta-phosphoglucomutase-like phosphatase (HAD superfamily)